MTPQLPKTFYWGTSTSAHQIEGNNTNSDWWEWEQHGHIKDGSTSGKACNSWNLFDQDLDAIRYLGTNAYRFSIEWAKIEPKKGKFDRSAILHYRENILKLRKYNIEPFVTLHHFTNPRWTNDFGGWENREIVNYFTRYVVKITQELGNHISFWTTINEPLVLASQGWHQGVWPPQKKSICLTFKVIRNFISAHKVAYRAIHQHSQNKSCFVGIAKNNQHVEPYTHNISDNIIAHIVRSFWNHYFFSHSNGFHDYIGLNYYFHNRLHVSLKPPFFTRNNADTRITDLGWEIYPHGLYETLLELKKYHLPVYILENGCADAKDNIRSKFITSHIHAMKKAMRAGTDVRGYFYWSLMDNFEWHLGFAPRFGLFETNYSTFARTPRPSAHTYRTICKTPLHMV